MMDTIQTRVSITAAEGGGYWVSYGDSKFPEFCGDLMGCLMFCKSALAGPTSGHVTISVEKILRAPGC